MNTIQKYNVILINIRTVQNVNNQADQGLLLHAQIYEQSFKLEAPPDCSVPHLVGFHHCFHLEVCLLILLLLYSMFLVTEVADQDRIAQEIIINDFGEGGDGKEIWSQWG